MSAVQRKTLCSNVRRRKKIYTQRKKIYTPHISRLYDISVHLFLKYWKTGQPITATPDFSNTITNDIPVEDKTAVINLRIHINKLYACMLFQNNLYIYQYIVLLSSYKRQLCRVGKGKMTWKKPISRRSLHIQPFIYWYNARVLISKTRKKKTRKRYLF